MGSSLEEGNLQPILERSYTAAHCGLLNAERLSGLAKPEMLRDRQAVEQPGEIQVRNRSRFSVRNHEGQDAGAHLTGGEQAMPQHAKPIQEVLATALKA